MVTKCFRRFNVLKFRKVTEMDQHFIFQAFHFSASLVLQQISPPDTADKTCHSPPLLLKAIFSRSNSLKKSWAFFFSISFFFVKWYTFRLCFQNSSNNENARRRLLNMKNMPLNEQRRKNSTVLI